MELGPELGTLQDELRAWISEHAVGDAAADVAAREWERRLLEARLVCPQWPEAAGGRGWDAARLAIFEEECRRAGVRRVGRGVGESVVGPTLMVHGSDAQRTRLLPRIIEGRDAHCLAFSEPEHGSDLAGVETTGEVVGDQLVVSGMKTWTSEIEGATHAFVLCRTGPQGPEHRDLSVVLVPLRGGGVRTRPVRQMSGRFGFSEIRLEAAGAPMENVIGGLGGGWRVAMTALGFQRAAAPAVAPAKYEREFWELVGAARQNGRDQDPLVRQDLAWAYAQVQLMRVHGQRVLAGLVLRGEPGPEAALTKLLEAEYHRRLGEIAMDIAGAGGMLRPEGDGYPTGRWQDLFLSGRGETVASGTTEVLRSVVAERVLGLPAEPQARRAAVPANRP